MKIKKPLIVVVANFLAGYLCAAVNASVFDIEAKTYYVSAGAGMDGDGSQARPFASLEAARNTIRTEMLDIMVAPGGATIQLDAGTHYRTESFTLGYQDAFPAYSQLRIQGAPNGETIIHLGKRIDPAQMIPVQDPSILRRLHPAARGQVYQIDLDALGVSLDPLPILFKGLDGGQPEVYAGAERLPIARYPNQGTMSMGELLSSGRWWDGRFEGGIFKFKDDRHMAWKDAVADGLWLNGFWRVPWQSWSVRVESIDARNRTVQHSVPIQEGAGGESIFAGIGSKYTRASGTGSLAEPYIAFNLLEELDLPGEWCVDYTRQRLYIWPPEGGGELSLAYNKDPVFELKGASQVFIQDITFRGGRENGIEIYAGLDNVVQDCRFINLGGWGVIVQGGFRNGVRDSYFTALGKGGIQLSGGDPVNLVSCHNFATGNTLHHLGILENTWNGAIKLGVNKMHGGSLGARHAVGISVTDNVIYDMPQFGMLIGGNDNQILRNEIFDIAKQTKDVGYIYTRHDWTSRGNLLADNLLHGTEHAYGLYLDDGVSGSTLLRNVVIGSKKGILIGGGHYHQARDNIIIDCTQGIHLDERGVRRNYTLSNQKKAVELMIAERSPRIWKERFPEMDDLRRDRPEWPKGNVLSGNHFLRCETNRVFEVKNEALLETISRRNTVSDNTTYPPERLDRPQDELVALFRDYLKQHGQMPERLP